VRRALWALHTNTNLTVLPADNDKVTVVLNTSNYNDKVTALFEG
jgi:hypothetical protein